MSDVLLETNGLARWYGQVIGVNDLSVTVEGGIVGLLGPNGAGKSTLLKLVAGEIRPSRGTISVLGHAPFANRAYLRRLGFCPQQDALYADMTGVELVTFLLRLHGYGRRDARRRAERALDRTGLVEGRERATAGYSKGMRQRVKLAQAIAHEPELLVADEPLTGLDPVGRLETIALLRELAEGGTHVLVSSHVLHEVEDLTSDILLLRRGRLLAQGDVAEVRALLDRHPRRVELEAADARRLAAELLAAPEVRSVSFGEDSGSLAVETTDLDALARRLTAIGARRELGIRRFTSPDASLEAVFEYLMG